METFWPRNQWSYKSSIVNWLREMIHFFIAKGNLDNSNSCFAKFCGFLSAKLKRIFQSKGLLILVPDLYLYALNYYLYRTILTWCSWQFWPLKLPTIFDTTMTSLFGQVKTCMFIALWFSRKLWIFRVLKSLC